MQRAHATAEAPLLSSLRPELCAFDATFVRALDKRPNRRFQRAGDLFLAIEACAQRWMRGESTTGVEPVKSDALRILVVDDDPDYRRLAALGAQKALLRTRLELMTASSGVEALRHALRAPPALVLLDYDMPGLDGIDTLSRLRAIDRASDAHVIVVSATVRRAERWRFGILGVTEFLDKKTGLAPLVATIALVGARKGWIATG
jgi:CheY-like chemotaxis protein